MCQVPTGKTVAVVNQLEGIAVSALRLLFGMEIK